jgi:hypothetical protein
MQSECSNSINSLESKRTLNEALKQFLQLEIIMPLVGSSGRLQKTSDRTLSQAQLWATSHKERAM